MFNLKKYKNYFVYILLKRGGFVKWKQNGKGVKEKNRKKQKCCDYVDCWM